ncbi:MAG: hypothetical protein WC701_13390, partial [Kiritimatiellales bacterium]
GFVLAAVLLLLLIGSLVAGAFMISARQTLRTVERWENYDNCLLAAKTAMEKRKWTLFNAYNASSSGGLEFNWTNAYWIQNNASSYGTNGVLSTLATEADDFPYSSAQITVTVTNGNVQGDYEGGYVYVTNQYTATFGGVTRRFEDVVKYVLSKTAVFENSYFINNYGWFENVDMVVNGDIRSNFNIKFNAASLVLNGNAEAGWTNIVNRTPVKWTYDKYKSDTNHAYFRPGSNYDLILGSTNVFSNGYNPVTYRSNNVKQLTMPYIGNLEAFRKYAQDNHGTISNNLGCVVDAVYSGTGPSGYSNFVDRLDPWGYENAADRGSIVLRGTPDNPIRINGPVVIDKDVIITGFYTGSGTIYAGRNIHIIGDLKALDPPVWKHPDTAPNFTNVTLPNNLEKDYMGLCAKGSIVLGDYNDSDFISSIAGYLHPPFTDKYQVSATDSDIGYVSFQSGGTNYFNGNYTNYYGIQAVGKSGTNTTALKYYESSISDTNLTTLSPQKYLMQIDAVLYDNHLIAGKLGASGKNALINGCVICRDEALSLGGRLYINWDARLALPRDFKAYLPMKLTQAETILRRELPVP